MILRHASDVQANLHVPWNDHQTFVEIKLNAAIEFLNGLRLETSSSEVFVRRVPLTGYWILWFAIEGIQA